ncbi:exo-alpha-sialidase [Streptomyces anthocyanicus]|uniref:exo-alpha-sialidase n=1 Tax=Streptomyces anthocyanicus TaxID=68174 RepID=UPI003248EBF8
MVAAVWAVLSALLLPAGVAAAAPVTRSQTTVFTEGEREAGATASYVCFRAPAVVKAADGTLLAFAEGRIGSCSDTASIDIVVKRYVNGAWSALQVVARHSAGHIYHNVTPVVDAASGRVVVLYTENYDHIHRIASEDDGLHWTAADDISADVWSTAWGALYTGQMATGPASAIQLTHGRNAGRLVAGMTVRVAPGAAPANLGGALIYSDDGGLTWRLGASSLGAEPAVGAQELSLFERGDGSLFVTARNEEGDSGTRDRAVYAVSGDQGLSFTSDFALLPDMDLPGTGIQASTLALREMNRDGYDRALFAAPVGPNREDLTIRSSFDGGLTWQDAADGALVKDGYSAYSSMTVLGGGTFGILYEAGTTKQYQDIRFATFTEADLDLPAGAGSLTLNQNTGALATTSPDQLHLFAPTPAGDLGHWFEEDDGTLKRGTWGTGIAGKTVAFNDAVQQHVLARGTDGSLIHRFWSTTGLSSQTWLAAGTVAGAPTGFVASGQQHAWVRMTDGRLLHTWWDAGTASLKQQAWAAAGTLAGDPVAVRYGEQQHVWATGTDGRLHHWWWTKGPGIRHELWPGSARGAATALVQKGQLHVYAADPENRLTHWWWDSTDQVVKSQVLSTPTALAGPPISFVHGGQQHVFARITGNTLAHWWWDPTTGNNYAVWPGPISSDPVAQVVGDTQHVYGAASDGTLSHWWWNSAEGTKRETWGGSIATTSAW